MKSRSLALLFNRDRTVFISGLFLILLMVFGANSTVYADEKVYPGSMCVRFAGPSAAINSSALVVNTSQNQTLRVVCPIIHDQTPDFTSINFNSGWVRGGDRNNDDANQQLSCRFLSAIRLNGNNFFEFTGVNSSINGDPVQLNFPGNLNTESSDHYFYRCNIPSRDNGTGLSSFITSYQVDED